MKNWSLRGAMLAVLLFGTVALGWPSKAKAFYCCPGAYCETDTTSPGHCGGSSADACWCYGDDGSESYDAIDCAFM
jgi:hypothetical protein